VFVYKKLDIDGLKKNNAILSRRINKIFCH